MADDSPSQHAAITHEVLRLFAERGASEYGGEAVTQQQHALQAALFAEQANSSPSLIVAALLHDVGHLLHHLPDDAPERGVDDRHESLAAGWLKKRFSADVVEPVRLHVAAKRYLCAIDPNYLPELSPPSILSLRLQGGPMTESEVEAFAAGPYCEVAASLRRWDDAAKIPDFPTPPLEHFAGYIDRILQEQR